MPATAPLPPPAAFNEIVDLIQQNQNFLIIGHIRPDGDCLGSCLGLYEALRILGKNARFYTAGPVPVFLSYLPHFEKIETAYPADIPFDAILCVDTSDADRVHQGFQPTGTFAVIDHHISNPNFGTINWVDGAATAAAEMVYFLVQALGVSITPEIATCLYTGMMTDTGGFRFGNTKEITFKVASDLVACGANPAKIAEYVFDSRSPATVKITSLVLSTLNYEFGGRFVWNSITQEMIRSTGDDEAEPEGLSSEMRSIRGVDVAVLFYESPEGFTRIGFRSRGLVNVSELASLLGGGGHKSASGAYIEAPFDVTKERALGVIRDYLQKTLN